MSERKILYYPTILVPLGWLKWTTLYSDKVSSIVPEGWDNKPSLEHWQHKESYKAMKYLKEMGEFEFTRPQSLFDQRRHWGKVNVFENEFVEIVNSPQFRSKINRNWRKYPEGRIHRDKISYGIYEFLRGKELAEKDTQDPNWYLVEENTSLLYMALLAKYLADVDLDYTTPSTDWQEYETMVYESSDINNGFPSLNAKFLDVLPVPRDDVSIKDILKFKKKRKDELLHFREVIDRLQREISHAETENEIKQLVVQYNESLEREVSGLKKTMKDSRIKTIMATFKSLIDIKSPALIEAIGFSFIALSPAISIPIISATAAVQIGYTWIDNNNRNRVRLRESPFSFLYYAREKRVI